MGVYIGTSGELKNAYIGEVWEYTISNIPTTDTNVYVNVARSWKTIQSVTFNFTVNFVSGQACYIHISSNNSNTQRYGMVIGDYQWSRQNKNGIRGRLSWSDTYYREVSTWFNFSGTTNVIFAINRNWNCSVSYNWTVTSYTATGTELTILQTIMNLSNMNVYASQTASLLSWNKVNVEVTYS